MARSLRSPTAPDPAQQKSDPQGPLSWSGLYSGLVDDLFDRILGVADGPLSLALELLRGAFDLKFRITDRFADTLLDRAGGFVGRALDFIGCAGHDDSPELMMTTHC